jgi:dienelactone hydrolase
MMGGADESMSIPACESFQSKLTEYGVDAELIVYESAGHGWNSPKPQQFEPGKWVTRDCVMRWTNSGKNIEATTGYSMESTFGVLMAFSQCANQDGYTQGFNRQAHEASRQDLLKFLQRTWNL